MLNNGVVKQGEICPGLTWEAHAESVAQFTGKSVEQVLIEIDGDTEAGRAEIYYNAHDLPGFDELWTEDLAPME